MLGLISSLSGEGAVPRGKLQGEEQSLKDEWFYLKVQSAAYVSVHGCVETRRGLQPRTDSATPGMQLSLSPELQLQRQGVSDRRELRGKCRAGTSCTKRQPGAGT